MIKDKYAPVGKEQEDKITISNEAYAILEAIEELTMWIRRK